MKRREKKGEEGRRRLDEQFLASAASIFSTSFSSRSQASLLQVPSSSFSTSTTTASSVVSSLPASFGAVVELELPTCFGPAGMLSKHQAR